MRRLPTMLASASAAALTTLAITVAVPAIADNAGGPKSADEFPACLRDHGLSGAPEGAGLKAWLERGVELNLIEDHDPAAHVTRRSG